MRIGKTGWLAAGAVALGVFAARRLARDAKVRRDRVRRGELTPLSSVWRQAGGVRMHACAATGGASDGTLPAVLVHGFGMSGSYLVPTAERLATRFDVYIPDLPGHGRSGNPPQAYGIEALADALLDWMRTMHIERAALVANSMGCQIAVAAALRDPAVIERLVLIGPTLDPAARDLLRLLARFVRTSVHEDFKLSVLIARDYARVGPRIAHELRAMRGYPMEEKLPQVSIPALLVRGEHDAIAPRAWLERAASLIGAHARWTELAGAAHAANYGAADALVERIEPFLSTPRPARLPARTSSRRR